MSDDHYIQAADQAVRDMLDGVEHIEASKNRPLTHIILGSPMRAFFIAKKAIFMKAVIAYAKVFGTAVNKEQTSDPLTHCLIDAFAELLKCNQGARQDFLEAVAIIVPAESSHDRFYRDRLIKVFELLILDVLAGKFPPRELNSPDSKNWTEEEPYGGQHTIIARLALYGEDIMEMIRWPKDENDEPYRVPSTFHRKEG